MAPPPPYTAAPGNYSDERMRFCFLFYPWQSIGNPIELVLALILTLILFVPPARPPACPSAHGPFRQALDFYLTDLLAKYQKWLVESPAKMEIRLDNAGSTMKEMVARQVRAARQRSWRWWK